MVLINSILTENPCYKAGKKITPTRILLMGVRCPQPSARVFAHNWNHANCDNRCVHAFIDANDGAVIQTLPWNHRGRLTGKHPRTKITPNDSCIGIKMCEPAQIRYATKKEITLAGNKELALAAVRRTYESAVELVAKLCVEFNIDPKENVISQREGYRDGLMAQHSDPELLWDTLGTGYTMDGFRTDVMLAIGNKTATAEEKEVTEEVTPEPPVQEPVSPAQEEVTPEPVVEEPKPQIRKIRIDVDNLRIRSGPEVGNNSTGKYTGKGVFEITEIQNGRGSKTGWGKLASGDGWVCLDYVTLL